MFHISFWRWGFRRDCRDSSDSKSHMNTLHSPRSSPTLCELANFPLCVLTSQKNTTQKSLNLKSWPCGEICECQQQLHWLFSSERVSITPPPQPQHALTSQRNVSLSMHQDLPRNGSKVSAVLSKSFLGSFTNFKNKKNHNFKAVAAYTYKHKRTHIEK